MSEKSFENKIKQYLESRRVYRLGNEGDKPIGYYTKRWGGGRYIPAGMPDLQIMVRGVCVDIEIKDTNGRPSELQKQKLKQINRAGGYGLLLYPKDFERFQAWFDMLITWPRVRLDVPEWGTNAL